MCVVLLIRIGSLLQPINTQRRLEEGEVSHNRTEHIELASFPSPTIDNNAGSSSHLPRSLDRSLAPADDAGSSPHLPRLLDRSLAPADDAGSSSHLPTLVHSIPTVYSGSSTRRRIF